MSDTPVVLVTGGSSGIGRQIVEAVAESGARVYASMRGVDGKNRAAAEELRELAASAGRSITPLELDVRDDASVARAVQTVVDETGRIDTVVNNAGYLMMGIAEAFSLEQAQQLFDTNFFGAVRVNQAVLPHMRRQGSGLLVYTASSSGQVTIPFMSLYGASKAALETLAVCTHYELFSLGIDTVILQLGAINTGIGTKMPVPERAGVQEGYGPIGHIFGGFAAGMAGNMSLCPHPGEVGRCVAEIIAMPAGQRPLRLSMGAFTDGIGDYNQIRDTLQDGMVQGLGLGVLAQRASAG